jgi:hypothetical protein
LILTENLITNAGLEHISTMFEAVQHLENLNLSENLFGDSGVAQILQPDKFCPSLKSLHLNRNLITAKTAIYLTKLMQPECKKSLDKLYLGGVVDGRGWGDEFAAVFTNNMVSLDTRPLKKLSLPDAGMSGVGLQYMAMMLICADRVEHLNISRNDFTSLHAQKALLTALTINPVLRELNIRRCGIDLSTQHVCTESLKDVVYETWTHEVICASTAGKEIAYSTRSRAEVDHLISNDWVKPYLTDWYSDPFEFVKNSEFMTWTNVEALFFGISKVVGPSKTWDIKFCEQNAKFIGKLEIPLLSNIEDLEKETVEKSIMKEVYKVRDVCMHLKTMSFDMRRSIEEFFTHIRTQPEKKFKKKMMVTVKEPKSLCDVLLEGHLEFEDDDDDEFRENMERESEQLGMILEDWRAHQHRCCEGFQYAIGHSHSVLTYRHYLVYSSVRPNRRTSRSGSITGLEAIDMDALMNPDTATPENRRLSSARQRVRRLSRSSRRMSEIWRPSSAPAKRQKSHMDVKFNVVKAYFEMEYEYQLITGAIPSFPRLRFAAAYVQCLHQYWPGRRARLMALEEMQEKERQKKLRHDLRMAKRARRQKGMKNVGFVRNPSIVPAVSAPTANPQDNMDARNPTGLKQEQDALPDIHMKRPSIERNSGNM